MSGIFEDSASMEGQLENPPWRLFWAKGAGVLGPVPTQQGCSDPYMLHQMGEPGGWAGNRMASWGWWTQAGLAWSLFKGRLSFPALGSAVRRGAARIQRLLEAGSESQTWTVLSRWSSSTPWGLVEAVFQTTSQPDAPSARFCSCPQPPHLLSAGVGLEALPEKRPVLPPVAPFENQLHELILWSSGERQSDKACGVRCKEVGRHLLHQKQPKAKMPGCAMKVIWMMETFQFLMQQGGMLPVVNGKAHEAQSGSHQTQLHPVSPSGPHEPL